jgi:spermidine synthase
MYEIVEWLNRDEKHCHRLDHIIYEENTPVQNVKVGRLARYGLSLLLNDRIQSTEFDEAIYHEGIVLPAYFALDGLEAVLCVGGANGGIIREILKCPSVRRVEMIDIDQRAFEICRAHLPHMFHGVNWDERICLKFGDVCSILNQLSGPFNVVFNDVADAIQGTAAVGFYTTQHFSGLKKILAKGGLLVTQAGAVEHIEGNFFASVRSTLSELFRYVTPYLLDIPSYGLPWGFLMASDAPIVFDASRLRAKLGALTVTPKTYDEQSHSRMFNLPLLIRTRLQAHARVITSEKPMLTFGKA